jgi:hypothetical protein
MTRYLVEMKPTPPLEPLHNRGPAATVIGEASDATVPSVNNRGTELFHLPCSALEGACSEQHGDKSTVTQSLVFGLQDDTRDSLTLSLRLMDCDPGTSEFS